MWTGLHKFLNKQMKLHLVKSHWKMTHFSHYNSIILNPRIKDPQWNMLGWISSVTVSVSLGGFIDKCHGINILCRAMKKWLLEESTAFLKVSTFCLSLWDQWSFCNIKWQRCCENYVLCDVSLGHLAIAGMKLPTDAIAISITALGYGSTVHFHLANSPNKSPSGQVTF